MTESRCKENKIDGSHLWHKKHGKKCSLCGKVQRPFRSRYLEEYELKLAEEKVERVGVQDPLLYLDPTDD